MFRSWDNKDAVLTFKEVDDYYKSKCKEYLIIEIPDDRKYIALIDQGFYTPADNTIILKFNDIETLPWNPGYKYTVINERCTYPWKFDITKGGKYKDVFDEELGLCYVPAERRLWLGNKSAELPVEEVMKNYRRGGEFSITENIFFYFWDLINVLIDSDDIEKYYIKKYYIKRRLKYLFNRGYLSSEYINSIRDVEAWQKRL